MTPIQTKPSTPLSADQAMRYSRHIFLDELGVEGQAKLIAARVLIIGAGGLGSPASLYLASAGVGQITLVDADTVDLSNLQRQILHNHERIGQLKALSGQAALSKINPEVTIIPVAERVTDAELTSLIQQADVVLDCCDNYATRHAINRVCLAFKKPLVSASALRFTGQLAIFDFRDAISPCYHCLFPDLPNVEEIRANRVGVFAPVVGVMGALQASEALKILAAIGKSSAEKVMLFDGLTLTWRSLRLHKDPECSVCGLPKDETKKR